jgi:hypothetical protein
VLGARITVEVDGRISRRDLASGDSYLSSHDGRAHFGLGRATRVDRVRVRWPDGTETVRESVSANRLLVVTKGASDAEGRGDR